MLFISISILLVYLYCLGARRRQWMPFRPPFAMAGEQFIENASSNTNKIIPLLI